MDGYAVVASSTRGCTDDHPVLLEVVGRIAAGETAAEHKVNPGQAIAISTGAPIPEGADAVVMVEHTSPLTVSKVYVYKQVEAGTNVTPRGEDVTRGQVLLRKGAWLKPHDVGIIASVGIEKIEVIKRPEVALFSTGDELVEPGGDIGNASVFESNRYMLSCLVSECGGQPIDLGICRDDKDSIERKLRESLDYDMIVISGGSSVGEKDFVPSLIRKGGRPGLIVHGVSMKPGSPTALGIINAKPIISTPGYPVSAFFAFQTFGKPLLYKMQGTLGTPEAKISAKMQKGIKLHDGMRTFVRVKLTKKDNDNDIFFAEPISASGGSILSTLAMSDGVIVADNKKELRPGQKVEVTLFRNII
jgi:molybdopterin molybdotransferase